MNVKSLFCGCCLSKELNIEYNQSIMYISNYLLLKHIVVLVLFGLVNIRPP